jgi:MSHA biogenesis protein MshI
MFSLKEKSGNNTSAGITVSTDGIALALVEHKSQTPTLKSAKFYSCSESERPPLLAQLVKQHRLDSIPCNLILGADEYQMLQVEAPDVPKQELSAALRWHVKDLIDFHIDDAVIEHFVLQAENASGKQPIHVIASRKSVIQNHVDLMHEANCNLTTIDIAAMAVRNIIVNSDYASTHTSIGIINIMDDITRIIVLLSKEIYIVRTSNIGLQSLASMSDDAESQSALDSLALELQRTFDYYESYSRQTPIERLFILNGQDIDNLGPMIQQRLGIECHPIELQNFLTFEEAEFSDTMTGNCLLAIGGALRIEL